MRKWECIVCGFIYDEAEGWPDEDIPPGTAWEDVPEDWICPDCGVGKEDFEMVEAQQKIIDLKPDARPIPAKADEPIAAVHRVLDRLLASE